MRLCGSNVVEVFYDERGNPLEIYPRFCFDESMVLSPAVPCLKKGISLLEQLERNPESSVCFLRTYALGDILLLTPVFNWIKERFPAATVYLATVPKFMGLFKYWDAVETVDKRNLPYIQYEIGYYLDGVVERDHSGNEYSYKHRLDIYCEFLGIPQIKDPVFSLPYGEDEKSWAEGVVRPLRHYGKPVIAVQVSGSTAIKRLPSDKVVEIAERLSDICSLIFVHEAREFFGEINVMNLTGMTNVHQLTALIDNVDAVVTMDSGVLWIAHATKTPVIALLGPTRESERLKYHRNYVVVNLSEMVGCEPCFERMTRCKGAINCMNSSSAEEIAARIENGIKKLVYS